MRKPALVASLLVLWSLHSCPQAASPAAAPVQGRPKVGLVLSGGGARGAAHIGVLKVLEREGIPIDCVAGTSFGALVGGLYALGYRAREIEEIFAQQDWHALFSDAPERRLSSIFAHRDLRYQGQLSFVGFSPELPSGLFGGQKMIEVLDALTTRGMIEAGYDFDRLPIPFRAVATDLLTGRRHVFRQGRMTEALRASVAIPMLFTPVEKDGMLLVDGGLADNLPADVAREMGADFVIAVDVTSPLYGKAEIRSFFDVLDQSLSLLMRQNIEQNLKLVDFRIQPELDTFTYRSYGDIPEIEKRGEVAAEKQIAALRGRLGPMAPQQRASVNNAQQKPVIADIVLQGLKQVHPRQLSGDIRSRAGEPVDAQVLSADLRRLYATRLFESVDYSIDPIGGGHRLTYLLKEAPLHTLGASIRYDQDYKFVALAEFTARQVFGTPSTVTLSSQFGGLEEHALSLRYIYPRAPALFLEPKVHFGRLERLDIRDKQEVDKYTDRRLGGQMMIGGVVKRLEVSMGYRQDSVRIEGGSEPNRQADSLLLAGLALHINRDTLDDQEFARSGMRFRLQVDKRARSFGSDLDYSRWQGSLNRYWSPTDKSTVEIVAAAGYSHGPMPFYERFYSGGYTSAEIGPSRLLGFSRDELAGHQMALGAAGYRRQIFSNPASFARRGFLFGTYNIAAMSDQETAPHNFEYFNGVGLGLAVDTLLGPARITVGWGNGGRFKLYLSMGPAF
jgi:NTE family protein